MVLSIHLDAVLALAALVEGRQQHIRDPQQRPAPELAALNERPYWICFVAATPYIPTTSRSAERLAT